MKTLGMQECPPVAGPFGGLNVLLHTEVWRVTTHFIS